MNLLIKQLQIISQNHGKNSDSRNKADTFRTQLEISWFFFCVFFFQPKCGYFIFLQKNISICVGVLGTHQKHLTEAHYALVFSVLVRFLYSCILQNM